MTGKEALKQAFEIIGQELDELAELKAQCAERPAVAMDEEGRIQRLAYSVDELTEVLGIGRIQAYDLVNREDFPKVRTSAKRMVIPVKELDEWIRRQAWQQEG